MSNNNDTNGQWTYRVRAQVDPTLVSAWVNWMQTAHIPSVMQSGCFTQATFSQVASDWPASASFVSDTTDWLTFETSYGLVSPEAMTRYLADYAPRLRQEGPAFFGQAYATQVRHTRDWTQVHAEFLP